MHSPVQELGWEGVPGGLEQGSQPGRGPEVWSTAGTVIRGPLPCSSPGSTAILVLNGDSLAPGSKTSVRSVDREEPHSWVERLPGPFACYEPRGLGPAFPPL